MLMFTTAVPRQRIKSANAAISTKRTLFHNSKSYWSQLSLMDGHLKRIKSEVTLDTNDSVGFAWRASQNTG